MNSSGRIAACLGAVLFATAGLQAAEPPLEQFAASFDIQTTTAGPYFRVALPADVFRYSRTPDLADLRVFNAAGEQLPFALYAPSAAQPEESAVTLPVLPIETAVQQAAVAGGRLEIRQRGGATTVVIEGDSKAQSESARVAAYLLDARDVEARAVALELDADFERAKLVPITVQASRDLKSWRTLAAREPLFRLGQGTTENVRTTVRLARGDVLDGEFLRLTWSESARFELRAATLKTLPAQSVPPPPSVAIALGVPVSFSAREAQWQISTPLRFSQLDLRAAETNTLAPVTVMARTRIGEPWRAIGRGVMYRIESNGDERVNPALQVSAGSYAEIKLVLDEAAPTFGAAPPAVALRLPPREIAFLARGAAPYRLMIGHDSAPRVALPLGSLVPGYERDAERAFALAGLGAVRIDERRLPRPPTLLFGRDTRTLLLWAVLIGAVLLLSAFAFSLLRKVNRGQSKDGTSTE